MDAITFQFLTSLVISKRLDMYIMDVITTYLYGFMEYKIYMKIS